MPSFNLVLEPWIPLARSDGGVELVGLKKALVDADKYSEVYTDSPVEVIALRRLLLALAIRMFPETDEEGGWYRVWEEGKFNETRIEEYFKKWNHRFNLLDDERPFYQHPEPLVANPSAISKLFIEEASGNNATLFSHTYDDLPRMIPLDQAARGLVATQFAALGGGVARPFNFSHAPMIAGGAVFWIRGASLFHALMLNAPPTLAGRMGERREEDVPAWETEAIFRSEKRPPRGYLDYLTWQSRRLKLETVTSEDGSVKASQLWISQGDKEDSPVTDDPLLTYRESKDKGLYGYRLNVDQAVWRDANLFFSLVGKGSSHAPRTFEWVSGETEELGTSRWLGDIIGLATDQAKVDLWRWERMPLFAAYLRNEALNINLQRSLDAAGEQATRLRYGCWRFAEELLFPESEGNLSRFEKEDVNKLVDSLGAVREYWSSLEIAFYELLETMARDRNPETALDGWEVTLKKRIRDVYDDITATFDSGSRHLRAVAIGRRALLWRKEEGEKTVKDTEEVST